MKKRLSIMAALVLLLVAFSSANVARKENFLAAAATITASTTVTNGTEFTSTEIEVRTTMSPVMGVTATFTRTTGGAATLDIYFQVSYDGGTTWADFDDATIQISANHTVVTANVVRYYQPLPLYGVTNIRISKMVNNWAGGSLTAVNATLTMSAR